MRIYVFEHTVTHICTYILINVYTHIRITCMHTHICRYLLCIQLQIHTHILITYLDTHLSTTYVETCIHDHVNTCSCIHI